MAAKSTNYSLDDDSDRPMLIGQFETLATHVRFESAQLRDACKAVLVDDMRTTDAARQFDLTQENVSRKVGQLRTKWKALCDEAGLENISVAFPPALNRFLAEVQEHFLEDLKRKTKK